VPGTTGELDFGDAPDEAVPGLGLSPLALGMLLGMIVLTGLAGGLVLQSRIDALDEQFVQVDQRLQVLMGDVRRQGETLRSLLADPASSQTPSTPGEAAAPAAVASLEQGLAAQRQQVETVAQAVARHDAQLAELERRSARAEQRPAPAPARPEAPVATPGGYVVVLASLPLRDQALQQLDLLRAKGLKAVLREAQVNGRTWYRVQTEGFADREAADRYAREAATRHGVDGVWVAAPGG
jgi:cell division septation protein DedD